MLLTCLPCYHGAETLFMNSLKLNLFVKTLLTIHVLALTWNSGTFSAQAQANPPTWMPMTMLNITFDTNAYRLSVVDEATLLGTNVYPVLTIATNGTYDPTKPWSVLNGTAFSRRLGWDDANRRNSDVSLHILNQITNAYGVNAGIWIEDVSHSLGFNSYLAVGKYGVNASGATNADGTANIDPTINGYAAIFGTAGSSSKWKWDGQMDHNTYAVSLSDITATNQLFTATYKVYVGDSLGSEILNKDGSSASTTEVWTWQGPASLVPPTLAIGKKIVVSWPGIAGHYVAESAESPNSDSWNTVTNTPVTIDGKTVLLIDPASSQSYYRLRLAP